MTVMIREFRATYAFVERNVNLIKRYWTWELVWLVYSIADSLSVSFIGLGMGEARRQARTWTARYLVLYLLIGTLVWRFLSTIFYWITDLINIERWEGTIEYTLMAPIRRMTHMAGQTIFAVVYSLLFTGVILAVTAILFFNIDLSQRQPGGRHADPAGRQPVVHRHRHHGLGRCRCSSPSAARR